MRLPPAVVIHGIDHASTALASGAPVTLLSARGAALYAGCGFWRALIDLAATRHPGVAMPDILDCADASGYALAALRLGQRLLLLTAEAPGRAGVAAIAVESNAVLLLRRPAALDLAQPGAARRLEAWLSGPGTDDIATLLG